MIVLDLSFSTRRFMLLLSGIALGIILLGGTAQILRLEFTHGHLARIAGLFSLDNERNIATWYSTLLLLLAAGLLALNARAAKSGGRPFIIHWAVLAAIFIYLALDEGAALHEKVSLPMQSLLGAGGALRFAWVIPFGLLAAVVFLAYLPFLRHLPPRIAAMMLIAGGTYVFGAIGMETISGLVLSASDSGGMNTTAYQAVAAGEEVLELTGVLVFIHALLTHLKSQVRAVHVAISGD
jgi:hypothetical protein